MTYRTLRYGPSTTLLLLATALARPAIAQPAAPKPAEAREQCIQAHREAQELRQSSRFLDARRELLLCSSASCPGALIADCSSWLDQLAQDTPSLVFELKRDGQDAAEARVSIDGVPIPDWSHASDLDPGRHSVRVELAPFAPHEEEVVLREGQRMRVFSYTFESPKSAVSAVPSVLAPMQPSPPKRERPVPTAVYPLAVLGVVGMGAFGTFAYLGDRKQKQLESDCSPECSDEQVKSVKRLYLVGDIALGVGAASLVSAAVVFLTRPSREVPNTSGATLELLPTLGKGGAWGMSARGAW